MTNNCRVGEHYFHFFQLETNDNPDGTNICFLLKIVVFVVVVVVVVVWKYFFLTLGANEDPERKESCFQIVVGFVSSCSTESLPGK